MKTFIKPIANGGLRIFNSDIHTVLQSEIYDAIKAILKGFGTGPFIISGCVPSVSGGILTITPGFIFINDDIVRFNGFSGADDNYWIVLDTPNIFQRLFKNLTTNNALTESKVKLVTVNPGGSNNIPIGTGGIIAPGYTLSNSIINIINNSTTSLNATNVTVSAINDCLAIPSVTNLNTVITTIRAYLCALDAAFDSFVSSTNSILTTLVGLAPTASVTVDVTAADIIFTRVSGSNVAANISNVVGKFVYNYLGSKMFLDYYIEFDQSNNSNDTIYSIELKIPDNKTRANIYQNSAAMILVEGSASANFGTSIVLGTNSGANTKLKFATGSTGFLGSFPNANDVRTFTLRGQISFDINP